MNMITGTWGSNEVKIDGVRLDPGKSLKLRNHSPDGFSWGYFGSGPSQLALALLLECGFKDKEAMRFYQQFKQDIIARLPQTDFTISGDKIRDWISRIKEAATAGEMTHEAGE